MIYPIILSGGSGSRLWPLSREAYPKQLLSLVHEHSLLQETVSRLTNMAGIAHPIIVTNEKHRFLVAAQLQELGQDFDKIILEPCPRNTAPAIALAAQHALTHEADPLLLVMPSDHIINNLEKFHEAIHQAIIPAKEGKLVTFGIVPNKAMTGYGYIEKGDRINEDTYQIKQFIEKPPHHLAEQYVSSGHYYWNSGMFLFKASSYCHALESYAPEIHQHCQLAYEQHTLDLDFVRVEAKHFAACASDSIDYAIMEKSDNATVVALNSGWSDVGSWEALFDLEQKDEHGNVLTGDVITTDVSHSYIRADKRMVVALGLNNHIVIETDDAILIAEKQYSQQIKQVVTELQAAGRDESLTHRTVYRPWGHYECLTQGDGFQVKRITVKPGQRLSLQLHEHRAEHWVVVRGSAHILCADKTTIVNANQSFYVPIATKHRIENQGDADLELIEVQSGHYLGEDDIIRFSDDYGR